MNLKTNQGATDNNSSAAPQTSNVITNSGQELNANQVRISDGRIIEMRELTGRDEMIVDKVVATEKVDSAIAYNILNQRVSMWYSIISINGVPVTRLTTMKAVYALAEQFKSKDTLELVKKYQELNMGEVQTPKSDENSSNDEK